MEDIACNKLTRLVASVVFVSCLKTWGSIRRRSMREVRASLLARAGSTAAVAVLAGGGVLFASGAASAAAGHSHAKAPTTLHASNKLVAHNHHHADALTGVLRSHRKGLAGETITLEGRAGTHRKWVAIGTGTTGSDGSVTFTVTLPSKKTQFEMVFAGDSTHRKSHSNVVLLKK
jgi:hypothetical protein